MNSDPKIRVVRYDGLDDTTDNEDLKRLRMFQACAGIQRGVYDSEREGWKILQETRNKEKDLENLGCNKLGGKRGKKARKSKKSRKSKRKSKKQKKKTRKSRK